MLMICAPGPGSEERRYGLPPGAESSGVRPSRVLTEQLGARDPGERCRVLGGVVANAAADLFQFCDPRVDPPLGSLEQRGQLRAEWLVRAAEVLTRELLDLLDREPER